MRRFGHLLFATMATALSFAPQANAAAQRTFVASYGSSSNASFNCSITNSSYEP